MALLRRLAVLVLAFGCITTSHAGVVALDHTGGGGFFFTVGAGANPMVTAGWAFSVSSTVTVDALGFFDRRSDGLVNDHDVGLWTGAGVLLTQATVTNASTPVASTSALGGWLFEDINPLVLTAGDYVVGATFMTGDNIDAWIGEAVPTTISEITYEGALRLAGAGLVFPTNAFTTTFFGPTLSILQVPEPASLALFGIALAGLGLSRRKRRVK